jgi:sensor histidine kinase YesM
MNLFDRLLSVHKKHRWLAHVAYWTVVLLVDVSASKYSDGPKHGYGFEFISDFVYEITYIISAYVLAYFIIPRFFYPKKYVASVIAFIVLSYCTSVLGRIITIKINEPLEGKLPKAFETYAEILTDIPKLIYVYFFQIMAAAFIFVFFKMFKDQIEVQKRALTLEKEKAETELKLLKTQLNPHFLFNTLNNIYSLSFISSPATSESIARLAEILDHILYRCNAQFVPLSAEIALLKNYIELEKLRYDKRLKVRFDTHIVREIVIAPLVLLSLVENAFKHGASDDTGSPTIAIDLRVNETDFVFNISNTVAAQKNRDEQPSVERIGLNNLRRQLDLIYGADYSLEVTRQSDYFKVCLTIALKQDVTVYEKSKMLVG